MGDNDSSCLMNKESLFLNKTLEIDWLRCRLTLLSYLKSWMKGGAITDYALRHCYDFTVDRIQVYVCLLANETT